MTYSFLVPIFPTLKIYNRSCVIDSRWLTLVSFHTIWEWKLIALLERKLPFARVLISKRNLIGSKWLDVNQLQFLWTLEWHSLFLYDINAGKANIKWYQSAIGSFIWQAVHTRPDIAYSVRVLSCYCSNSGPTYCNLVVQVFQYHSATLELEITFTDNSENNLVGYTDSD